MAYRTVLASVLAVAVLAPEGRAADPADIWSGFHAGLHVGGLSGKTNFSDPAGPALFGGDVPTFGFLGGIQFGYDWAVAPRWVVGAEAGGSLISAQGSNTCLQSSSTIISSDCRVMPQALATFTGRLGWTPDDGRLLLFGRGGLAWMRTDTTITPNRGYTFAEPGPAASQSLGVWGWTVGAGLEYAFAPGWSLGAEYGYLRFTATSPTPETVDVALDGTQSERLRGSSGLTFDQHLVKLGVNWRWGARSSAVDRSAWAAQDRSAWQPGWELDVGTRYWYSSGVFRNSNGNPGSAVSRLTYDHLQGHSGELFARLDSPFNVFAKLVVGGGFLTSGFMNDEDWPAQSAPPVSYSNSVSGVRGSFHFLNVDLGYDLLRGPDHKIGPFVGFSRYQIVMSAFGCAQVTVPASPICEPPFEPGRNSISEIDTWDAVRVGVSGEVKLSERFKLAGDFAYLPIVHYNGLDIHHLRIPPVYFPVTGVGLGVQAEMILSWQATESWSIGVGGRYWALWTTNAQQTDAINYFDVSTERYGVFVQAAYKFGVR